MSDGENNFAEFEQQANEPPADPPAEEPVAEAEVVAPESEEAEAEAAPAEELKPKKTAQERIDEITRARREAEREAAYWRNVAEGKTHKREETKQEEAKAPNPDDFPLGDMDPQYVDALVDFRVKQGLDKIMPAVAQNLQRQAGERVWEAAQEVARSKHADFDAKVIDGAHNWPCTEGMAEAIKTSDAGGELAYHLASNPEEARRISALPPIAQIRELGRIEATLVSVAPVRTTNAPKPPQAQARGAGGQSAPSASTTNFAEFEAMAKRAAG